MRVWTLLAACGAIGLAGVAAAPGAGAREATPPDPLIEVARALAEGRHWHAARLLRRIDGVRREPTALLLAARADAGRNVWPQVVRRLRSAPWLDHVQLGEGRALLARAELETGAYAAAVRNFRIYLGYAIEREPRGFAEVGFGRALARLGWASEAAAAYGRAAALLPELAPWLAMRAAESLAVAGDTAGTARWLARARGLPGWRRDAAAADAHHRAGDTAAASRMFLNAAARRDAGSRAPEFRTRAARALLSAGDTAAAKRALRAALSGRGASVRAAADLLAGLPGLGARDRYGLARSYERSGAPIRAAEQYREYLARVDASAERRERLELKIGELLFRGRHYASATAALEPLARGRPNDPTASRADYLVARALYRRGRRAQGRARLRSVADRHPQRGVAVNALWLLGDLYEYHGDADGARAAYGALIERYPWSSRAAEAAFHLGILAYQDGDARAARDHFDRARSGRHGHELWARATYWAARARRAGGADPGDAGGTAARAAEAERLFQQVHARDPFGYYGLLAAERAGLDPWAGLAAGPQPRPIEPETRRWFEVIDLLKRAGLDGEVEGVLDLILDSKPDDPAGLLGLAGALAEHGFGGRAVVLGWETHARLRGRWSANVLRAIYPIAYPRIILAESRSRDLDPHLVASVARQESAFAPDATSRAGARGLLQIMPRTGREWARRLRLPDYRDELLFHPEINVHLGTALFADLQRRYSALELQLVAYNAGPTRARRWQRRPAFEADLEVFIERIPIDETRKYVKAIHQNLRIYRRLYADFGSTGQLPGPRL